MSESFAVQPVVSVFYELETTDLEITQDPGFAPTNIVSPGQSFDIALTFQGDPTSPFWAAQQAFGGSTATVTYFAESIGPGGNNLNLGAKNVNLVAGQNIYGAHGALANSTRLATSIALAGVYRLSCQLSFNMFPFVAGFYEGTLLNVQ